jgi:plasmid maintenance system antidote protein VapI
MSLFTERRAAAPHPGPIVQRQFLDPLGISADRLAAMLEGRASIDVETAVRLSRSLQLPGERLMQMQVRFDFSAARAIPSLQTLAILKPVDEPPFPQTGFIRGHLRHAADDSPSEQSLFFQEELEAVVTGDEYAGLHALWQGDRLRIYGSTGETIWVGPILQNLDGRILLPFARLSEWTPWFSGGYRADLAIGPEHAAFFERMREG